MRSSDLAGVELLLLCCLQLQEMPTRNIDCAIHLLLPGILPDHIHVKGAWPPAGAAAALDGISTLARTVRTA